MSRLTGLASRSLIIGEFFSFLWRQKLWWMIPMFLVIGVFGLLLVLGQSSPLASFIYTLF